MTYSKRLGNYQLYPREIQMALDNNDYRYAEKWLEKGWLESVNGVQGKKE